ncbi:general secretion pathway protein N [Ectothiorhodospira magna]|uniref:Type II secretion system protein N n=1 Tax=Ectothiorhodospira magna TaxID=867345 RepID=A0A1H9C3U6_9GAMM|nr:type II secretion system protein N [Ectothiorhodospira magna]SEP95812.1 general secretion pathway protein N [Ectothiorhodospira magna]
MKAALSGLGVMAYLICLLLTLPASLAWQWLDDRGKVPEHVELAGISGTFWQGQARQVRVNGLMLSDLQWQVRPLALLRGELRLDVRLQLAGGKATARLGIQPSGLGVQNLRADLPAAALAEAGLNVPLIVQGRVLADIAHLELDWQGRFGQATGVVGWLNAAMGLPEPLPLGDLRVTLRATEAGHLQAVVQDQGGPLFAEGTAALTPDGAYQVHLRLGTREGARQELSQALGFLGRPDREGRIPLNLSGRF